MSEQLDRAYDLIQEDRDDEALDILRPIVIDDPDNAAAWWLISYATDDPKEARLGLINTLKNDPDHQHAREMLAQLNAMDPPTAEEQEMMQRVLGESDAPPPRALPEAPPSFLDDIDLFDELGSDDQMKADAEQERQGFSPLVQLLLGVILVVIVVVMAITLLQESEDADDGRADLDDLSQDNPPVALANLDFGNDRISVFAETDLGTTLFVRSCACVAVNCSGPGPDELPAIVLRSIEMAVEEVSAAGGEDDVAAVGVNVLECNGDDTLYQAYVALDAISDDLTLTTLQNNLTVER